MNINNSIPILPLRDIVVLPYMVVPLFVGREASINALSEVMKTNKKILLITQKYSDIDLPKAEDLYKIGTVANVLQLLKLPDGTLKVLVEGKSRVKINNFTTNENFLLGSYSLMKNIVKSNEECKAYGKLIIDLFGSYINNNKNISSEVLPSIKIIKDMDILSYNIIPHLNISLEEKQKLLEESLTDKRLEKIYSLLESEMHSLNVEKKIKGRVKRQMEKTQREYYLNEQMKAIQKELGEIEDGKDEITNLHKSILKAKMTKEAQKKMFV